MFSAFVQIGVMVKMREEERLYLPDNILTQLKSQDQYL